MNKSILYYTGNWKNDVFSQKIRDMILKNCGDIPILSVSQKPLNFGTNICVGEVGHSYLNAFRQMLVGARAATTEYLLFAEDDTLYPEEYFTVETTEDYCCYDNVWMVRQHGVYIRMKHQSGAQLIKRELAVKQLEEYLEGAPEWHDGEWHWIRRQLFCDFPHGSWSGPPIVMFKPQFNLSRTSSSHPSKQAERVLPMWGEIRRLRREYGIS